MQLALQDIRRLGSKKITRKYMSDDYAKNKFMSICGQESLARYSYKVSSYAFLRNWGTIKDSVAKYYTGMNKLVHDIEPFIDQIEVDDMVKRKFRNQYESIWGFIGKDLSLEPNEVTMLSDLGLKMALSVNPASKALDFFNSMFIWYLFTSKEVNFERSGLTFLDVLEVLCVMTDDEFTGIFLKKLE